ncbi:MAG: hypothetical protein ACR2MS_02750 [Weeksellaceae bacterium]
MLLERTVIKAEGKESLISSALEDQRKEKASIALYISSIILSFFYTPIAMICYALVAFLWLMPDKRIEKSL